VRRNYFEEYVMKKRLRVSKVIILMLAITTASVYAKTITTEEYSHQFKSYNDCFILYSVNKHKVVSEYNPSNRCNQRIAPDSTFKIALSPKFPPQFIPTQAQ
jgi:beta-lactamase class D